MDAAALYAGTVLLRKTFEALAQRSVTSLFGRLHSRFRGQHKIEFLQQELESKLQVLSLPVDMCVQYVLHGNTVLQGALDMVVRVINDIVRFQEELESQAYNEDIVKTSPSEAETRLQGFLTRLDAILPYMAMAMNAVSLLKSDDSGFSPSRLMQASHLIRTAAVGEPIVTIPVKLYEYETKLKLPCWQEKIPNCHLTIKSMACSSGRMAECVIEILSEATDDEQEEEKPLLIPIASVISVGSSTLHVLGLGQNELEAVLLLDVGPSSSAGANGEESTPEVTSQDYPSKAVHYAFQCREPDDGTSSDGSGVEEDLIGARTAQLGVLQYVLRLCILQIREEKDHWLIPDERIKMFFADPRFLTEPMKNVVKAHRSTSDSTPLRSLTPVQKQTTPVSAAKSFTKTPTTGRTRKTVTEMFYELNLEQRELP